MNGNRSTHISHVNETCNRMVLTFELNYSNLIANGIIPIWMEIEVLIFIVKMKLANGNIPIWMKIEVLIFHYENETCNTTITTANGSILNGMKMKLAILQLQLQIEVLIFIVKMKLATFQFEWK